MRPDEVRISPRLRAWFFGVMGLLYASGTGWLLLHAFARTAGEFGPRPHAAEPWLLRLHGAAAMVILVLLGILLPLHVLRGWRAGRNRATGALLLGTCLVLALSGYALYYAGGERLRAAAALLHDAVGLGLPALLAWHVLRGRRQAKTRRPP
jgi:hypothetical protein